MEKQSEPPKRTWRRLKSPSKRRDAAKRMRCGSQTVNAVFSVIPRTYLSLWLIRLAQKDAALDWEAVARGLSLPPKDSRQLCRLDSDTPLEFRRAAKFLAACGLESTVSRNAQMLASRLGLSVVEEKILHLFAECNGTESLSKAVGKATLGSLTEQESVIVRALQISQPEYRSAMSTAAALRPIGLVTIKDGKFGLNPKLQDLMHQQFVDGKSLLDAFFAPPAESKTALSLDDFGHVGPELADLVSYLSGGIRTQERGINILLHGQPGTGKSTLARVVAQTLGQVLIELNFQDDDGDPVSSSARLINYTACQNRIADLDNVILLFEELEDVFERNSSPMGAYQSRGGKKAWFNRRLESNEIPTIWTSNQIDHVDPSFLRRFDFVLHLKAPPLSVRQRMVESVCESLPLSDEWKRQAARDERLLPADLAHVVRVATISKPAVDDTDRLATAVLAQRMSVSTRPNERSVVSPEDACAYDLTLVNADHDLEQITMGLERVGEGRLCLCGAPGTGKSAFGMHLAERLGRPLISRRASDILGRYVGQTEQRLAEAFAEAAKQKAILLLDEVDSFLANREGADKQWEVSQVNEFLTQMETFNGILVCTTNLMGRLDTASMRRFDLKVEFKPLRLDQRVEMCRRVLDSFDVHCESEAVADMLKDMGNLGNVTPGDFAAAARKLHLLGQTPTVATLATMLRAAVGARGGRSSRPIGFRT